MLRKSHCRAYGRYFRPRMPGILPYRRSTEPFRRQVYLAHRDGISREQLRCNCKIGTATVERWFHDHLELKERMFSGWECPEVLGIDEHFFSKKACQPLIRRLVDWIWKLRYSGFPAMETLAETLDNWSSEIACMWRFTKNC